ncbi:ComEC/Rec2 family competence protein [Planctomycetota bacterium]
MVDEHKTIECWFLDVGQGSSNVIYLGNGEAIVIDCGPGRSKQTLRFLERHVDSIKALIFSHNDSDHINGAVGVLTNFFDIIEHIYFLADGKHEKIVGILNTYDSKDKLPKSRLEYGVDEKGVIYNDGEIKLEVIYPGFISNIGAEKAGTRRANQTSAILKLTCGKKRVIFSGDATIEAWEHISEKYFKEQPFHCDIMTIPHHGGKMTSQKNELDVQKKMYSEIIKPEYGIISVGTCNRDEHPCPETISALIDSGVEVLCTQMTSQCCSDLEKIREESRIITQPSLSSREKKTTVSGKSKDIACLGTITVKVSQEEIKIDQLKTHEQNKKIFNKITKFNSLCAGLEKTGS